MVKKRFSEDTVREFLELRWWRFPFTCFEGLDLANPDRFIAELRKRAPEEFTPHPVPFHEMPHD